MIVMFNTRMQDCFLLVHVDRVTTGQEMVRGKKLCFKARELYFEAGKIYILKKSQGKLK